MNATPLDTQTDAFETLPPPTGISGRTAVEVLLMLGMLALLANTLLIRFSVSDAAMTPALINGQSLLLSRLTYQLREPRRGEIVLVIDPNDANRRIMRRVIGLPGETIELRGDSAGLPGVQVAINGRPLSEPYVRDQLQNNAVVTVTNQLRLSSGEYFVMTDNRAGTDDSRSWGPVRTTQLAGRAWLSLYPVDLLGLVDHDISSRER
jgi:signal peptidase I